MADLLARMTLEEKVSQLGNNCPGIKRLGLPPFRDGEVEHGVAVIGNSDPAVGAATVFPQAIAMSATFNRELIFQLASAIADEVRAKYTQGFMGLAFCSPVIDLCKDPRWGRAQECFGEDPLLAATLGAAFIRGLSGEHVRVLKCVAGPKHITANSCEETRRGGSVEVDERSFWEYYIRPFEKCHELYPYTTIMPSYNGVNGMPGCANDWLLNRVLREMIGFDGYVLSDGQAVYDLYRAHHLVSSMEEAAALSIASGCDVSNGYGLPEYGQAAVESGLLPEHLLDLACARALKARFRLGLLDPPETLPYGAMPAGVVNCKAHRGIALQTALESIVLLKNDGLLPLRKHRPKIAIVGNFAKSAYMGTYSGIPTEVVTAEQGMRALLGADAEIHCDPIQTAGFAPSLVPGDCLTTPEGAPGLKAEFFKSRHLLGSPAHIRTVPNVDFDWRFVGPVEGWEGESPWSVRFTGYVIAPETQRYRFTIHSDNAVRFEVAGRTLVCEKGEAPPRCLYAEVELTAGVPASIVLERMAQGEGCRVALGWDYLDRAGLEETLDFVKAADYVIACLGTDRAIEDEATDRLDITLPDHQEALLKELYAANPKTVAVFFSGGPISSRWADAHLPAVLQAWYFGERGGEALASILTGRVSPAGRMPVTTYRSVTDLPPMTQYDLATNGMTYLYCNRPILYPFGHGLSYTTFAYRALACDKAAYRAGDTITLSVEVGNLGDMDADEVVQFYACALDAGVPMPLRQLVGFERVHVPRNHCVTVRTTFPLRDLYRYDSVQRCKVLEPGRYKLMAGASCLDIRATQVVTCQ